MILSPKRLLAIGAHPDDLELGCYGMLESCPETTELHCLVLTTLAEDGFGEQRIAESTTALQALAPHGLHCARLTHAQLVPSQWAVALLSEYIAHADPDLVLTHTRWDTHQDHRAVEAMTLAACRRRPVTILGYQTISTTPDFPMHLWVDVTQVFDRKLAALRCFASMKDQPYMQEDWQRAWHYDRSATAMGLGLVEAFHVYRMVA